MKHLKVVITTATFAMGVKKSARTIVFAGDHPDFNPLAYRQMMGRAGRQGYDNFGNPPKYLLFSHLKSISLKFNFTLSISKVRTAVALRSKVQPQSRVPCLTQV